MTTNREPQPVTEPSTLESYRLECARLSRRCDRLDAEVRGYLDRLELVTLERDQLREAVEAARVGAFAATEQRNAAREELAASRAECGRLIDRLEALEAANPPRPTRAEVADYADERDRVIAANRDDHDGPWEPVLSGRIPTAGGMGAVVVHDPDDPVARAFFLDHPAIPAGTPVGEALSMVAERRAALEAQRRHDREVAALAEIEVECPNCGLTRLGSYGPATCPRCGIEFEVTEEG